MAGSTADDLDLRIIGALQVDGRRPVVDIARELGVSKSTVQRRLDALIRDRVIMITPYADSAKLGLSIHVQLNLSVDLAQYQEVLDAVVELDEVRWVAVTTGPADIIAEAFFASPEHLHQFLKQRLATIPGITGVATSVILSIEKFTFHWEAMRRLAERYAPEHFPLGRYADSYHRGDQRERKLAATHNGNRTHVRAVDLIKHDAISDEEDESGAR